MSTTCAAAATALLAAVLLAGCGGGTGEAGSEAPADVPSAAATTTPVTPTTPMTGDRMTTSAPGPTGPGQPDASSRRPTGGSLPLLPRPTAPPTAPTDLPQPVVLVGEVVEPSAAGCVEMTSGGQVFSLDLPAGTSVAVGDRVRVSGTPKPVERGTTCAGTRVVVTEVAPAG